jgi:phenylalanyl-tRNA synthetase alpha chain
MIDADQVGRLRAEFDQALSAAATDRDLQALRDRFLGRRNGAVTALFSALGGVSPEARRELGRIVNELKAHVERALGDRRDALAATRLPVGGVDVTLAGRGRVPGHRHPLNQMRERMEGIFARWGFEILDGPESEDDWHNFEALNMPPEHPARDMQDTLYLAEPITRRLWGAGRSPDEATPATLLRTHTSPMQIRYMETHRPPVRIVCPGRVYRRDNLDVTHTPMFQQVEGLVVGEGVSMADLKGTIIGFLRELFAPDTKVLFRPSFFPDTEPSADVFIGCINCGGAGCGMCKRTGWIEVLGCGMVNPPVFAAVGYDVTRITGFAFGIGIERLALLLHGVDDIRTFYENDLRFLEQFPA